MLVMFAHLRFDASLPSPLLRMVKKATSSLLGIKLWLRGTFAVVEGLAKVVCLTTLLERFVAA